jgi:2-desacetyl-2-hydroxyethyl bacteriochlorophyllide A dehydrogenase
LAGQVIARRQSLWFLGPGKVELRREELGAIPPDHVLVQSKISAISAGTELLAYRGELPPDLALDETLGSLRRGTFSYPFQFGYASVGDVVDVGSALDRTAWMGRRVFAFHPHATAFMAPATEVLAVPDELPSERAVLFAHMETAVNLALDGGATLGENVLLIGQGMVGLLATALLARFPLSVVVAAEGVALRAQAARALGARSVITCAAEVAEIFGARGADLIYELSGDPDALNLAIAVAGHEARVVVGSWYGQKRSQIDLGGRFHRRRLRLISSQVSHIGAPLSARWDRARRADATWRALVEIDTLPLISHRFSFEQCESAYQLLDRNPACALQLLLLHSPT